MVVVAWSCTWQQVASYMDSKITIQLNPAKPVTAERLSRDV